MTLVYFYIPLMYIKMAFITKDELDIIHEEIQEIKTRIDDDSIKYNKFVNHIIERITDLERIFPEQLSKAKDLRLLIDFITHNNQNLSEDLSKDLNNKIVKIDKELNDFKKNKKFNDLS